MFMPAALTVRNQKLSCRKETTCGHGDVIGLQSYRIQWNNTKRGYS